MTEGSGDAIPSLTEGSGDAIPSLTEGSGDAIPSLIHSRLPSWRPVICLITDRQIADPLHPAVAAAVTGGVNMVQLREKDLTTRELLGLALRLQDVIAGRAQLVVNGRADVAFAVEAAGLHLPADGLPPEAARAILGQNALIGRSVHSVKEVAALQSAELDYLELGTIFPSRSHPGGSTLGLELLGQAARAALPVIAVGGITAGTAADVVRTGVAGVAVISEILGDSDPRGAAERLTQAVLLAWDERQAPVRS